MLIFLLMKLSRKKLLKNSFIYAEPSIPENTTFSKKLGFFSSNKQSTSQKVF